MTNNETDYEAVIAGLKLARGLGVERVAYNELKIGAMTSLITCRTA